MDFGDRDKGYIRWRLEMVGGYDKDGHVFSIARPLTGPVSFSVKTFPDAGALKQFINEFVFFRYWGCCPTWRSVLRESDCFSDEERDTGTLKGKNYTPEGGKDYVIQLIGSGELVVHQTGSWLQPHERNHHLPWPKSGTKEELLPLSQTTTLGPHEEPGYEPPAKAVTENDLGISTAEVTSMALDATPVVSNLKSAAELFSGTDLITGDPVSRWIALLGIVPVLGNIIKGGKISAKVASKVTKKPGTLSNKTASPANSKVCTNACPISMVNGEELLEQEDFTLPGPLPLVWSRTYRSSHNNNHGLGVGWSTPWFAHLHIGEHEVTYRDGEGRSIPFARPDAQDGCRNPIEKLTLYCDHDSDDQSLYRLVSDDNLVTTFYGTGTHGRLSEITNSAGHAIALHYNADQQLETIRDSAGRYLKLDYTDNNRLHTVTLCDSESVLQGDALVTYTYSPDDDLIQVQDAAQQTQHYAYQNHVITQRTTADGFHFYFTWDEHTPNGKCLRNWGDDHIYDYRFDYDPAQRTTRSTDGRGHTTVYHYNALGLIVKEIDAEGGIHHSCYDDNGDLVEQQDPAGHTTGFTYNTHGRLTGVTDALGQQTALRYDPHGNLTQLEDAQGQHWQRQYTQTGQMTEASDPVGNTTRYRYNAQGLPVRITDALGHCQRLQWDDQGQLVEHTDGEGQKTRYCYDPLGRITQVIDHQGHTTHYDTDAVGNVTQIRHPDGSRIALNYTPEGRLTRYTDALNRHTDYEYDGLSQPVLRTDPDGNTLRYEYDKERNLTALINENGDHYTFDYDKNERLIKEIGFDGREQVYQYTPAGHLQRHLDGQHRSTDFIRDPLGQLLEKHSNNHNNDNDITHFVYDPSGRLTEAHNPASQLQYQYDPVGNLISESQNGQHIAHQYDAVGQRTQTTLPTGQTIGYQYNRQNTFTRVTLDDQIITRIERNQQGQETERHIGALTAQREYDPMGRLVHQQSGKDKDQNDHSPVLSRHYRYDLAGNLQQIDDIKHGKTVFQYDALDRLSAVNNLNPEQFHFDPAGNLLDDHTTAPTQGGWVKGNRLRVFQDYRFDYDDVGNLIEEKKGKHTTRFTYDAQNQLVSVAKAGQQFDYRYDPLGRRISKKDAFGETTYLWDGDTLVGEQRKQLQITYLYEPDSFIPLCQIRDKTVYYYHNDFIGTPQVLTDTQGEVVWQARYKVYGNVVQYEEEAIENPLRFQGQYFDAETGLHYNRHRYYHPVIGRFTSVDPIGLVGGNNGYEYAPNPVGWVDPLGLMAKTGDCGVAKGLPTVKKIVNSNMPHAVERSVERGVFSDAKAASQGLKDLSSRIGKEGFPKGSIIDTANANRVLVPTGNNGMVVYQIGSNGTAKLKTILIAK